MSAISVISYDQPVILKSPVAEQFLTFNHNKIMKLNTENL